jgi:hypothetical protein
MDIYPERGSFYLGSFSQDRPFFQGDVFRGVPAVLAAHPTALQADYAAMPQSHALSAPLPTYEQAKASLQLEGRYSILLPNPCEFSEGEKGTGHRERILAQLRPVNEVENQKAIRTGRGAVSTFWMPRWDAPDRPERDMYANFRRITSVDVAYLSRANRVAVLSRPAWIVLIQRLSAFFGGVSLGYNEIAEQVAHLFPSEGS